ncbi:hypothetical protein [Rubrivirga sp. IMCC43871]|uniref:hypothetical protein n=1 Tax=Rubrivirga sp. IMCC43871 TaxID=3391575 RepID=UPI00398FE390
MTPSPDRRPRWLAHTDDDAALDAEAALLNAAGALLDAAHAFDLATTSAESAAENPWTVPHALGAVASELAHRLHGAGDIGLFVGPHVDKVTGARAVPSGLPLHADGDALGVYVIGGHGADGHPGLRCPVDPADVALGPRGLAERATDSASDIATELWHGPFGDLVATFALAECGMAIEIGGTDPHAVRPASP